MIITNCCYLIYTCYRLKVFVTTLIRCHCQAVHSQSLHPYKRRYSLDSGDQIIRRGPRRMNCVMDTIPASAAKPGGLVPMQSELVINNNVDYFPSIPFFRSKSIRVHNSRSEAIPNTQEETLVLQNKAPRWHEQLQCWCLSFNGRVTVASVKNIQLVASLENGPANENVVLQFGKVGKDLFTMDYHYPISAFQAFAICLSSFDT